MSNFRPRYFLLNDDHSLREASLLEWAHAFEEKDRRVAFTGNATKYVSTIFLGLDHRHFGDGPPLVFETMVFVNEGKFHDLFGKRQYYATSIDEERYGSWKAAEAGHKRFVKKYLIDAKTRMTKIEEG